MIMGNILISGAEFDYEAEDTLRVRVESTDQGGLSFEATFIIHVTDVFEMEPNLSPIDITLDYNSIEENKPIGSLIGKLETSDPNEEDFHSYGLVDGTGGEDNSSFSILGDMVISSEIFDYETKNQYNIRVRSRDDGEGRLSTEKSFMIRITDQLDEVGIPEIESERILITPNPFSEMTLIRFSNPDLSKFRMYVTDVTGKQIYSEDNIYSGSIIFKRKDLPAGLYFIELRGPETYRGMIIIE